MAVSFCLPKHMVHRVSLVYVAFSFVSVSCELELRHSYQNIDSIHRNDWVCDIINCSCQDFANYYGTIAGYGYGCAPPAAQAWWSNTKNCDASIVGGKSQYCNGSACHLPGAAPCDPPAPPPPPPPPPPSRKCPSWATDPLSCVAYYNVEWDNLLPETTATWVNTMPIGNGIFAANVFANATAGSVLALISAGGAWAESGELFKVGLVNISFDPNPFVGLTGSPTHGYTSSESATFKQTMDLTTSTVRFEIGSDITISMYIPATTNALVVELDTTAKITMTTSVVPIRPSPSTATPAFDCTAYTTSADVILTPAANGTAAIAWYHHNQNATTARLQKQSYFDNVVSGENLGPEALQAIPDGIESLTFGGAVAESPTAVVVALAIGKTADSDLVSGFVASRIAEANKYSTSLEAIKSAHTAWWKRFWYRSHLEVSTSTADPAPFLVTRQFILQRHLTALQARSPFPIKFNGMLFTANKPTSMGGPGVDYRQWGGLSWWQNERSPYYSMLTAGDGDLLETLLACFQNNWPLAQARTQHYFNFSGTFWPEYTHPLFGTTHPNSYGCNRADNGGGLPYWYSADRWNHYNVQGGLDLSLFVLDHYSWTSNQTTFQKYLPMVLSVLDYYRLRWKSNGLDADGKIIMFPTQAVETYQCPNYPPNASDCVTNDTPSVAGLHSVVTKVLMLAGESLLTPTQKSTLEEFLLTIPPIPVVNGTVTAGAVLPAQTSNVENPELYTLHPYRVYSAAKAVANQMNISNATRAFNAKKFGSDDGWCQVAPDAALLGLGNLSVTGHAPQLVAARAAVGPAVGYRYPAFMPHFQDYEPSADHLGMFASAVTFMVLQPVDDANGTAVLLPAWPCEWDIAFNVSAPRRTTVAGSLVGGKLSFSVDPPSRTAAIVAARCQ
eukprot:m.853094 g.853094  ORF g.853094 m.853094 type:complete len:900 (-) comp23498_c0_seq3:403-3102(-)